MEKEELDQKPPMVKLESELMLDDDVYPTGLLPGASYQSPVITENETPSSKNPLLSDPALPIKVEVIEDENPAGPPSGASCQSPVITEDQNPLPNRNPLLPDPAFQIKVETVEDENPSEGSLKEKSFQSPKSAILEESPLSSRNPLLPDPAFQIKVEEPENKNLLTDPLAIDEPQIFVEPSSKIFGETSDPLHEDLIDVKFTLSSVKEEPDPLSDNGREISGNLTSSASTLVENDLNSENNVFRPWANTMNETEPCGNISPETCSSRKRTYPFEKSSNADLASKSMCSDATVASKSISSDATVASKSINDSTATAPNNNKIWLSKSIYGRTDVASKTTSSHPVVPSKSILCHAESSSKSTNTDAGLASKSMDCDVASNSSNQFNGLNSSKNNPLPPSVHQYSPVLNTGPNPEELAEKKEICEYCLAEFDSRKALSKHLQTGVHVTERLERHKPFVCKKCSQRFSTKADLRTHEDFENSVPQVVDLLSMPLEPSPTVSKSKSSHLDKLFRKRNICKYCSARFKCEDSLKEHQLVHINESLNPYFCRECLSRFQSEKDLNTHKLTHAKVPGQEKPKLDESPIVITAVYHS